MSQVSCMSRLTTKTRPIREFASMRTIPDPSSDIMALFIIRKELARDMEKVIRRGYKQVGIVRLTYVERSWESETQTMRPPAILARGKFYYVGKAKTRQDKLMLDGRVTER